MGMESFDDLYRVDSNIGIRKSLDKRVNNYGKKLIEICCGQQLPRNAYTLLVNAKKSTIRLANIFALKYQRNFRYDESSKTMDP